MVRIIDASIGIKWFVEEKGRETALGLLANVLAKPSNFAVRELFFFELIHVFHRVLPNANDTQLALLEKVLILGIPRFSDDPGIAAGDPEDTTARTVRVRRRLRWTGQPARRPLADL
ncbi:MAG TPA: hypothetical protein PLP42_13795 [Acidobacteriota bacterium]|nr:hypothetical protein [Acidobacteriota bacterium]